MHDMCDHDSVLLWQHCSALSTYNFLDDVTFSHNRPYRACDASLAQALSYSPLTRAEHISVYCSELIRVEHRPGAEFDDYDCLVCWLSGV